MAMDTKLTLKLDQKIIERAKVYAAEKKVSLSRLIESYLNALSSDNGKEDDIEISSFVKSISSKTNVPVDMDYKKAIGDHREIKHQ